MPGGTVGTIAEVDRPPTSGGWLYVSVAVLALVVAVAVGVVLRPVTTVIPGRALSNQASVIAATADRKAADDAAAAKKAADDAAALLASTESDVKDSMQGYFNDPANDMTVPHITVFVVNLIQVGTNKFEGEADMQAGDGPRRQILVHVTADQQSTLWSTDKGALLPLFDN
jgi:predicted metalloprotease